MADGADAGWGREAAGQVSSDAATMTYGSALGIVAAGCGSGRGFWRSGRAFIPWRCPRRSADGRENIVWACDPMLRSPDLLLGSTVLDFQVTSDRDARAKNKDSPVSERIPKTVREGRTLSLEGRGGERRRRGRGPAKLSGPSGRDGEIILTT